MRSLAPRPSRDRRAAEQVLAAALELDGSRARELFWLRTLAVACLPAWLAIRGRPLPAVLTWTAFLAQAFCLATSVAHALAARRLQRRAARLESVARVVQAAETPWDDVRRALWHGLSVVSLVPGAYVGLGRAMPDALVPDLAGAAWAILLLVAVAETLVAWSRHGERTSAATGP